MKGFLPDDEASSKNSLYGRVHHFTRNSVILSAFSSSSFSSTIHVVVYSVSFNVVFWMVPLNLLYHGSSTIGWLYRQDFPQHDNEQNDQMDNDYVRHITNKQINFYFLENFSNLVFRPSTIDGTKLKINRLKEN